jgi:hypothetical protein
MHEFTLEILLAIGSALFFLGVIVAATVHGRREYRRIQDMAEVQRDLHQHRSRQVDAIREIGQTADELFPVDLPTAYGTRTDGIGR